MTIDEYKKKYSNKFNYLALSQVILKSIQKESFLCSKDDEWIREHIEQNKSEYKRQKQQIEEYLNNK
jgi:hypothetical protein